jgi:hypothetical protein
LLPGGGPGRSPGPPRRRQVVAEVRAAIAELPEGSVVLAEDETHINLLPWIRST